MSAPTNGTNQINIYYFNNDRQWITETHSFKLEELRSNESLLIDIATRFEYQSTLHAGKTATGSFHLGKAYRDLANYLIFEKETHFNDITYNIAHIRENNRIKKSLSTRR